MFANRQTNRNITLFIFVVLVSRFKERPRKWWGEFRQFLLENRIFELGITLVMGRAFNFLVKSLVNDMLVGPVGMLLVGDRLQNRFLVIKQGTTVDRLYKSIAIAADDGAVTLNYGKFTQNFINFLFVGSTLFAMHKTWSFLSPKSERDETWECPYCSSHILKRATVCNFCTRDVQFENYLE